MARQILIPGFGRVTENGIKDILVHGFGRTHFTVAPGPNSLALTIDNTKVIGSVALTNYPALITAPVLGQAANGIFDADGTGPALATGADIRFTTDALGATEIPFEIVEFTTDNDPANGSCEIWVKIPSVATGVDTTIYAWWGDTGKSAYAVTDPYGRNAVWSEHEAVFHGDDLVDATGNGHTLTRTGTPTEGNAGKIGGAFTLNGSTDHYDVTDNITSVEPLTVQAWFKSDSASVGQNLIAFGRNASSGWMRMAAAGNLAGDPIRVSKTPDAGGSNNADSTTGYSASTWHMAVGVWVSTSTRRSFIDGGSEGIDSGATGALTGAFTTIGAAKRDAVSGWFDGSIDEARILASVLSGDWIATEYNNQSDPSTFWSVSAGATVEVALTLAATLAALFGADATAEAAATVIVTPAMAALAAAQAEALASLTSTVALATTRQATVEGAASLAASPALAALGGSTQEAAAALAVTPGLSISAIATTEAAAALATTPGLSIGSQASAEAAVAMAAAAGLTFNGLATAEGAVAFNLVAALEAAGGANFDGSLTLGSSLSIDATGGLVLEDSLTFAETSGIAFTGQMTSEQALALALTSGVDLAGQVDAVATISLEAAQALGLSAQATAEAGLDLATTQAMQMVATAILDAGLSLDAIVGIDVVGELAAFIVTLNVSPGRTIQVVVESRVVLVAPETRVITPVAETRTIAVKDE